MLGTPAWILAKSNLSNGKAVMNGSTGFGDKAEMMENFGPQVLILSLLAAVATPAA